MTTNTPAMSAMRQSIAEFFKFCSTCFIGYSKQFQKNIKTKQHRGPQGLSPARGMH
jgi:hypothetical protein